MNVQLSITIEEPADENSPYRWEPVRSMGDTREVTDDEFAAINRFMDCPPHVMIDRLIALLNRFEETVIQE